MVEQFGGYRFRYCEDVEDRDRIRIYIEDQPGYNGRANDDVTTHRIFSHSGAPPYICVKEECKPGTLSEAQELAHQWAWDNYRYISSGQLY